VVAAVTTDRLHLDASLGRQHATRVPFSVIVTVHGRKH
jgi:hypothetical protein